MTIEVKLPEIGDGIDSGDVLEVLVKVGDVVEKDQDILEMETDKATMGVPCTHAGTVLEIHVSEGQTVPVGATLITLEAESAAAPAKPAPPAPAEQQPEPVAEETPRAAPPTPAPPAKPREAPTARQAKPTPSTPPTTADANEVAAGPAVRRFAREVGVDLARLTGSGEGGRITRDDVLQAVRSAGANVASAEAAPPAVAGVEASTPAKPTPDPTPEDKADDESDAWGPVRYERLSKIRTTIANKMHKSWTTAPRVTNFDDADITELEVIRQGSKADYIEMGVKLTTMPFLIKAVSMALRAHPAINASIDLEKRRVIYKKYVNVGIAVDTERGLVVPCMRSPDQLSVPDIARRLALLADTVRTNDFSIEDLQGGTFTISNLGAIGGSYSTPIINVPEVAILLAGRARKMPVVLGDEVAIRLMIPLSLSYDHRLVDGATAARFLNDIISYLQSPSRLLLAP